MKNAIVRFLKDEEGATAIEYGIIAGMMALLLVGIFGPGGTLGPAISSLFNGIVTNLGLAT